VHHIFHLHYFCGRPKSGKLNSLHPCKKDAGNTPKARREIPRARGLDFSLEMTNGKKFNYLPTIIKDGNGLCNESIDARFATQWKLLCANGCGQMLSEPLIWCSTCFTAVYCSQVCIDAHAATHQPNCQELVKYSVPDRDTITVKWKDWLGGQSSSFCL
jgi:hypothetical protein